MGDTSFEVDECDRRDAAAVGLNSTETPCIFSVKATIKNQFERKRDLLEIDCVPHTQHIDEMLFCHVVLLVYISLQRCEDIPLLKKPLAALALKVVKVVVGCAILVGTSG